MSLFIDPDLAQLERARAAGAPVVELHTGAYADARGAQPARELERVRAAARSARRRSASSCTPGTACTITTSQPIAAIPEIVELNIGHAIVAQALFDGLPRPSRR